MRLIEGFAKIWWRRWSTWLAVVYAAVTAINPGHLIELLSMFPEHYRGFVSGGLFVLLAGIPIITAAIQQPKLEEVKNVQSSGNAPAA